MTSKQDDVPDNAPEHCPGTQSDAAGKGAACAGCPNQSACSSGSARTAAEQERIEARRIADKLSGVREKILVLSGKGGVGKSTVATLLALALSARRAGAAGAGTGDGSAPAAVELDERAHVGLMDVDVCGPSVPKLLGLEGERVHQTASGWQPIFAEDNLEVMSIGFILESKDDAVIWRGPKKNGLIKQFLRDVEWGELDYLVVDTPPGTSDEHLSVTSYLKEAGISGAVIVTQPQEVSLMDVRKEINFCRKVGVRILGVVENMSGFVCPRCSTRTEIFAPTTGGAERMCDEMSVHFLGRVPIDPRLARACDEGRNYLESEGADAVGVRAVYQIIDGILAQLHNNATNAANTANADGSADGKKVAVST